MTIHWCGTGLSSGPGLRRLLENGHKVVVWNRTVSKAQEVVGGLTKDVRPYSLEALTEALQPGDIAISMLPADQHVGIAKACLAKGANFVSSSYIAPEMRALDPEFKAKGLVSVNEVGLDPGIDHLYAVKTIEEVHAEGGEIVEFVSYCGGLPAPENSNNPLGYKFSWSSRGVLLALRNTARYLAKGEPAEIQGPALMKSAKPIQTGYPAFAFVGYPNRDSVPYSKLYKIPEAKTVLRGTLVRLLYSLRLSYSTDSVHESNSATKASRCSCRRWSTWACWTTRRMRSWTRSSHPR